MPVRFGARRGFAETECLHPHAAPTHARRLDQSQPHQRISQRAIARHRLVAEKILHGDAADEAARTCYHHLALRVPDQHLAGIGIVAVRQCVQHGLAHGIQREGRHAQFEKPNRQFLLGIGRAAEGLLDPLQRQQQADAPLVISRRRRVTRLMHVMHLRLRTVRRDHLRLAEEQQPRVRHLPRAHRAQPLQKVRIVRPQQI